MSFGCSKFFLMVDTEERLFKCGMQVERGYLKAPREYRSCQLASDWDWHRLLRALKPRNPMEQELARLVTREGFWLRAGTWDDPASFSRDSFPRMANLRRALEAAPRNQWAGFQVFYPMREEEVQSASGADLVDSMLAVFREVTRVMNLCMQIQLRERAG